MPKVSVITHVRNRWNTLKRVIPKVLNQTFQDFEYIIVDWGCQENSYLKANQFNDDRIKPHRFDADEWHMSRSKNQGAIKAEGDILFFLDADKLIEPTFLEKAIDRLDENSFVNGWCKQLDHDNVTYIQRNGSSTFIIHKKHFFQVGGFNEYIQHWGNEDCDLVYRLEWEGLNWVPIPTNIHDIETPDELKAADLDISAWENGMNNWRTFIRRIKYLDGTEYEYTKEESKWLYDASKMRQMNITFESIWGEEKNRKNPSDWRGELNEIVRGEHGKFNIFDEFKLPLVPYQKKNKTSPYSVVYNIWDSMGYAKMAYLSIATQQLYTDINDIDLTIVFSTSLKKHEELIHKMFDRFDANIIFRHTRFKYFNQLDDFVSKYDLTFQCDADLFMAGAEKMFYKRLIIKRMELKERGEDFPYLIFGSPPFTDFYTKLINRPSLQLNLTEEEVLDWINHSFFDEKLSDFTRAVNKTIWPWNVFYVTQTDLFSNDDQWKSDVDTWYQETSECWDEEHLFWIWSAKNNYPVVKFNDLMDDDIVALPPYRAGDNSLNEIEMFGDKLYLTHPLVFPIERRPPKVIKFIQYLINETENRWGNS